MRKPFGNGPPMWRYLLPHRRRGWLWVALGVGIVANGFRLRHRLAHLNRLPPVAPAPDQTVTVGGTAVDGSLAGGWVAGGSPPADADDFVVVSLAGVRIDDATGRAAMAFAQAENLDVVDLVPGDLPLGQALDLARDVDSATYRSAPFAAGRGAMHALVVRRALWDRMAPTSEDDEVGDVGKVGEARDRAGMVRLTERLKLYAVRTTDLAVAPRLGAVEVSTEDRLGQLHLFYGAAWSHAVALPAARSTLLLAGLAMSPGWGALAVAAFVTQPYLVTAGSAVHPSPRSPLRDAIGLITEPFELLWAARSAMARRGADPGWVLDDDPKETARARYVADLARGTRRFFEPRRDDCPWCHSTAVAERLRTTDLFQVKPGEFVLSECTSCGVLFQNPRLNTDGLEFYYRDFYDGLGANQMQAVFGQSESVYRDRAELVRRHLSPRRWLDVGTGYGHFCVAARGLLPTTHFDGLDMGAHVEEGQCRGWIDHGYRGLFPDLAPDLEGQYDVVSMHHYLEHTTDPRAELEAVRRVLEPGGHVLIEVPDPECRTARLLGRYWIPWLQPQHLQFLPVANLCSALEDLGFAVVEIEHDPPRPALDLAGACWTLSTLMAPPPGLPWRRLPNASERLQRAMTLAVMVPVGAVGFALGEVVRPLFRNEANTWSDAYRVLARIQQGPSYEEAAATQST